eukprot:GGOE01017821.1.p1 GENE.GGOE01017821.1~~GGOE01017821.1.p1  ORF type:complete len:954 (+),score=233.31 GGOE01017821.1:37-2862(+)
MSDLDGDCDFQGVEEEENDNDVPLSEDDDDTDDFGFTHRKGKGRQGRRGRSGQKPSAQYTHHGWDEGAMKRLGDGLERFGLDFGRITDLVGQRSLRNVRSRALKQLEAWARAGLPLPPRVVAMGGLKVAKAAVDNNVTVPDWQEREIRLLEEAMAKHGPNWAAVSEYVGTRDVVSVRHKAAEMLKHLKKLGRPIPCHFAGGTTPRNGCWTAEEDRRLQVYTNPGKSLKDVQARAQCYAERLGHRLVQEGAGDQRLLVNGLWSPANPWEPHPELPARQSVRLKTLQVDGDVPTKLLDVDPKKVDANVTISSAVSGKWTDEEVEVLLRLEYCQYPHIFVEADSKESKETIGRWLSDQLCKHGYSLRLPAEIMAKRYLIKKSHKWQRRIDQLLLDGARNPAGFSMLDEEQGTPQSMSEEAGQGAELLLEESPRTAPGMPLRKLPSLVCPVLVKRSGSNGAVALTANGKRRGRPPKARPPLAPTPDEPLTPVTKKPRTVLIVSGRASEPSEEDPGNEGFGMKMEDLPSERCPDGGCKALAAWQDPRSTGLDDFIGPQPFGLLVSQEAVLVMDLHAHLVRDEVIGYLAGVVEEATQTLRVLHAFPGRGIEGAVGSKRRIEMDSACEAELREQIAARGLDVVGWYHSHPTSLPRPSGRSIEMQNAYQTQFPGRPFVGAMVGPYSDAGDSERSQINWFVVQPSPTGDLARRMQHSLLQHSPLFSLHFKQAVQRLVAEYRCHPRRWDLKELWGSGLTRGLKCVMSLFLHLRKAAEDHACAGLLPDARSFFLLLEPTNHGSDDDEEEGERTPQRLHVAAVTSLVQLYQTLKEVWDREAEQPPVFNAFAILKLVVRTTTTPQPEGPDEPEAADDGADIKASGSAGPTSKTPNQAEPNAELSGVDGLLHVANAAEFLLASAAAAASSAASSTASNGSGGNSVKPAAAQDQEF